MIEAYAKKRDEFYANVWQQKSKLKALLLVILLFHLLELPTIISHKDLVWTIVDIFTLIGFDISGLVILLRYVRTIKTLRGSVFKSDVIENIVEVDGVLKNILKKFLQFGVYENDKYYLLELQRMESWKTVILLIDKSKISEYKEILTIMKIITTVKFKSEQAEAKPYWYVFNQYLYVNDTTPKNK
ncbi:hypothetical protein [Leuconostoc lactis]|uniref:hypothetical protein n=1 Tax=Leuconostoc lactis TaxID=1246 RepID=UPI0028A82057|nr:hypothetical protein [Leuconostoc lactis]